MEIRKPNNEQEKAIGHHGKVILNAGAGSGKTFVIVEHLCFKVSEFLNELSLSSDTEIIRSNERKIKQYLSSLVVITFTRDAAGELLGRIKSRVKLFVESSELWRMVLDNLSMMMIGTIHSFCLRVLAAGHSTTIGHKVEIVSEYDYLDNIRQAIVAWTECLTCEEGANKQIVYNNYEVIVSAMKKIFEDAQLRSVWLDQTKVKASFSFEIFLKEFIEAIVTKSYLDTGLDLTKYASFQDKKWYEFILGFQLLWKTRPLVDISSYSAYKAYFESFDRAPTVPKNVDGVGKYLLAVRKIREYFKKYRDDLDAYCLGSSATYLEWHTTLLSLFAFINSKYILKNGITFADIEYYALKELNNSTFVANVSEMYSYIIVDEFQDTSWVQFEIINKIVANDYSKLFVVGDLKQAIYGFRGGELGVFKECTRLLGNELSLLSNYRSNEKIVDFNNVFFEKLFPMDANLDLCDRASIPYVWQRPVIINAGEVGVERVVVEVSGKEKGKISFNEINEIEATAICKKIYELLLNNDYRQICIMYKKLSPSRFLIQKLIAKNIGFTAQVKIKREEEPIVAIFYRLLLSGLNPSDCSKSLFHISGILKFLRIKAASAEINKQLGIFNASTKLIGVYHSYLSFLYSLNISTSAHDLNLKVIEAICSNAKDDLDRIAVVLEGVKGDTISTDFAYGDNPSRVVIKTCHATKGLEYDCCILGGIHTNGRSSSMRDLIGKLPDSILWKKNIEDKVKYKSPSYILEQLLESTKEFAESKRLLYVAMTRAVKRLIWIELYDGEKRLLSGGLNWASIISTVVDANNSVAEKVFRQELIFGDERKKTVFGSISPLFHTDNCGVVGADVSADRVSLVGTTGEASVTKLSALATCPRKYYYQSICKILDEDVSKLHEFTENVFKQKNIVVDSVGIRSSAERGSKLHYLISELSTGKINLDEIRNKVVACDMLVIEWANSRLRKRSTVSKIYSEKVLKFDFFGSMIQGIPDLILINNSNSKYRIEIWDYKTGARKIEDEDHYWFQLYAYAYGCYQLGLSERNDMTIISLEYLDSQESVEKIVDYEEVANYLYEYWKGVESFERKRGASCNHCTYSKLFC